MICKCLAEVLECANTNKVNMQLMEVHTVVRVSQQVVKAQRVTSKKLLDLLLWSLSSSKTFLHAVAMTSSRARDTLFETVLLFQNIGIRTTIVLWLCQLIYQPAASTIAMKRVSSFNSKRNCRNNNFLIFPQSSQSAICISIKIMSTFSDFVKVHTLKLSTTFCYFLFFSPWYLKGQ